MTRKVACVIICLVWVLGFPLTIPTLLYATTVTYKYADQGYRTICYLTWPDGVSNRSFFEHLYNILFLVVTYVVPMCFMAVTYSWVGCILWGSKAIGENTALQNQMIKSKQKVVHMLIAIVLLFAICWLPYHIYFLYIYYHTAVVYTNFIQHVYLAIYWLAMSNSCYNPIVYYIMNAKFRNYFDIVLCMQKRSIAPPTDSPKSYPLTPKKANFIDSRRTRSTRLSYPRFFKDSTISDHEV